MCINSNGMFYIQSIGDFIAEIGSSGHGSISVDIAGDLACPVALSCLVLVASNLSCQGCCSDRLCALRLM